MSEPPPNPINDISRRLKSAFHEALNPPQYLKDAAWANFKKALVYGGIVGVSGGLIGGTSAFIAGYHGLASGLRVAFAFGVPTTGFFSIAALMRLFGDAPQDYIYTSTSVLYCSYLAVKRYKRFDVIPGGMFVGVMLGLGIYHGEEWARRKIATWQAEIQGIRAVEPPLTSVYDAARVYRERQERQAEEQQPFYEVVLERHERSTVAPKKEPSKISKTVLDTLESIGAVTKLDIQKKITEKQKRLREIERVLQQDDELRAKEGIPVLSLEDYDSQKLQKNE